MLRTFPGPDREKLGFRQEVGRAFLFLEEEHGFRRMLSKVTLVTYESESVFVNVYHGRASYEVGFEVGRLAEPDELRHPFTLYELLASQKALEATRYTFYQASTAERVRRWVPRLAALVRRYAGSALVGEEAAYAAMALARSALGHQLMTNMRLSGVRAKAEAAWRARDFAAVVNLYDPVRVHLYPSERARLEYARKRL